MEVPELCDVPWGLHVHVNEQTCWVLCHGFFQAPRVPSIKHPHTAVATVVLFVVVHDCGGNFV